jgi:hypothetical protein
MKRYLCLGILPFLLAGILYAQTDSTGKSASGVTQEWETKPLLMDPLGLPRLNSAADSAAGANHSSMWLSGHPQVLSAMNLQSIEREAQRWIRYQERMKAMEKDSLAHRQGIRITYPEK